MIMTPSVFVSKAFETTNPQIKEHLGFSKDVAPDKDGASTKKKKKETSQRSLQPFSELTAE